MLPSEDEGCHALTPPPFPPAVPLHDFKTNPSSKGLLSAVLTTSATSRCRAHTAPLPPANHVCADGCCACPADHFCPVDIFSVCRCLQSPCGPLLHAQSGCACPTDYSGPIEIFKFPDEVMVAAEALGLAPPFAIMASNTMEMVEDQLCPVRHYSWGTCMPLLKEHSDAYFFR